jgi:hypothetical protein
MNETGKGDLVYVPSGVKLYREADPGVISKYKKIEKPTHLLVTGVNEQTYEVLFGRETWLVRKNNTYGAIL